MKNQLIIFSKNRAMQLSLLLETITINCYHLFDKISVIYKADTEYQSGYDKLSVNLIKETSFKDDLMSLLTDEYEVTTLLVDDAVVYDRITQSKEEILNNLRLDTICFSLRLGLNCVYSHPADINYTIKDYVDLGDFIKFDYRKQEPGDFNYPLSTDGHIYQTSFLKAMLEQTIFSNPNTLEANIQRFVRLNGIPFNIICFKNSKVVSIPVNLVNTTFRNRHGIKHYFSEKDLNDRFLNGEIIDIGSMDLSSINGPHKEIEYKFKNEHN